MALDSKLETFRIMLEAEQEIDNAESDVRRAQENLRNSLLAVGRAEAAAKTSLEQVTTAKARYKRLQKARADALKEVDGSLLGIDEPSSEEPETK